MNTLDMHANILTYTQVISEGKVWVQLDASIRELPIFCPVDCLEPYHGQPLAATREGRKSGGETTEKMAADDDELLLRAQNMTRFG